MLPRQRQQWQQHRDLKVEEQRSAARGAAQPPKETPSAAAASEAAAPAPPLRTTVTPLSPTPWPGGVVGAAAAGGRRPNPARIRVRATRALHGSSCSTSVGSSRRLQLVGRCFQASRGQTTALTNCCLRKTMTVGVGGGGCQPLAVQSTVSSLGSGPSCRGRGTRLTRCSRRRTLRTTPLRLLLLAPASSAAGATETASARWMPLARAITSRRGTTTKSSRSSCWVMISGGGGCRRTHRECCIRS